MKSIIAHKPHLTARIVTSLSLQILLVLLLRQPHQESPLFNLGILVIAVLAMAPIASAPRWLPFWPKLMLRILGLFPLLVVLATVLHWLGLNALFRWLIEWLPF